MLPLYFISGIFIAPSTLPSWLSNIAKVFPVQHLAHGLQHAFQPGTTGIGIVWSDLGVMGIWAAIGLVVALRRFSWLPKAGDGLARSQNQPVPRGIADVGAADPLGHARKFLVVRDDDREAEQPRGSLGRRRRAARLPRVAAEVVVVAAGAQERGLVAGAARSAPIPSRSR